MRNRFFPSPPRQRQGSPYVRKVLLALFVPEPVATSSSPDRKRVIQLGSLGIANAMARIATRADLALDARRRITAGSLRLTGAPRRFALTIAMGEPLCRRGMPLLVAGTPPWSVPPLIAQSLGEVVWLLGARARSPPLLSRTAPRTT